MKQDNLGDRMKEYERDYSFTISWGIPVLIRLDGRAFHTYTKGLSKPYDQEFINAMWETAKVLCDEIHGAQFAYHQSDEISILIHNYKKHVTQPWLGKRIQKMVSVAAGIASGVMTMESPKIFGSAKRACFDARVWQLSEAEVANYFLWRQKDCQRNSVQMLAQSLFSHKQLHAKNVTELKGMCIEQGKNWEDLPTYLKRGACIVRREYSSSHPHAPTRSKWDVDKETPIFSEDRDYIESYLKVDY